MANDKDPFAHSERTTFKPTPGGRGRTQSVDAMLAPPPPQAPQGQISVGDIMQTGANPILAAATTLLAMVGQLRRTVSYEDIASLFELLRKEVKQFEAQVAKQPNGAQSATIASYVVCGFVDEAILNTPWGVQSDWANKTLLAEFHDEIWAGEKTFAVLERLREDPNQYLQLIELVYVCISLGFAGKYRRREQGMQELEQLRGELYRLINNHRPSYERELSPNWRGATDPRSRLTRYVPAWVLLAAAAGLMVTIYMGFAFTLGAKSDPVAARAARLGAELPMISMPPRPAARPRVGPTLVELLSGPIGAGRAEAGTDGQTIILRSLFDSGSANVGAAGANVLQEVASALRTLSGNVVVSGHTDNVPIRTLRFPSNWELSEARASAVLQKLITYDVRPERLRAQADADTRPVCGTCDQNAANTRKDNRRVEITLMAGAART
ncbi:MAG: type IVB secretion system protein IcmH/DotU [Pseudomonadales bacterium]